MLYKIFGFYGEPHSLTTQKIKGAWILEGKGSFVILLFIIAILTLTLAIAIGFIFFTAGTSQNTTVDVVEKEITTRPAEDKLGIHKVFEGKTYFNLKSEDPAKIAVIQVGVEVQYDKSSLKDAEKRFLSYSSEIKEIVGTYFQGLTYEEAKDISTKAKAKQILKEEINKLLTATEEKEIQVVFAIVFDEWFYQ